MKGLQSKIAHYQSLDAKEKKAYIKDSLINNALYILLVIAVIYTYTQNHMFISSGSIINIISLSAANLPIALGIAGCIVLTGTDLSAGRIVGLTACITGALEQSVDYASKMFPNIGPVPVPLVILLVLLVGGVVGFVNGFFVAKFSLHPFIVTLATQLIVYGLLLIFLTINGNNGQPLSGLDEGFNNFVKGTVLPKIGNATIPNYIIFALIITVIMWVVWNKTSFGKNMFAVGGNSEAAAVSGINVFWTTIFVFIMAGILYGFGGFFEAARTPIASPSTGYGTELNAIAACVIGGVSFSGGIGKISGVVVGTIIFQGLTFCLTYIGVDANIQYIFQGVIIMAAVCLDSLKYLKKK